MNDSFIDYGEHARSLKCKKNYFVANSCSTKVCAFMVHCGENWSEKAYLYEKMVYTCIIYTV